MNKFLHEPTVRLRAAAANGRGLGVVDAARYLFGLDQSSDHPLETTSPLPTWRVCANEPRRAWPSSMVTP